jgi:glyoxylase-like metal-dependent hydrolase (beta-lactamase superfamily II)
MPEIAGYNLYTVEAGRFSLDGGAMFGIVPKPLWERRIPADERNRIPLAMRCLLLEGEGRVILVDNGLGDKYDDRFAEIYGIDEEAPTLADSLRAVGFSFEDVTDVILSHLHFDHCGGSTRREGDRVVTAFPRATFHVQRAQWDWAQAPNVREKGSFFPENLLPLEESGQLSLIDGPAELFPGIEVRPMNGHTEAQQIVIVRDATRGLVFVADLLPTQAHLSPAWNMAYDLRPMVTIDEKAAFLDEAVTKGWDLFFEHDPFVPVAGLKVGDRGIETQNHRRLDEL